MISAVLVLGACSTVNQNPVGQNPEGNNGNNQIVEETPGEVNPDEQVMCTMDARMCPDGSYVGRTGPNCEFAACPGEDNELTISEIPEVSRIMSPEIVFNAYIEENIKEVTKREAVLGGNWFITSIENTGEGTAVVEYEDGHITGKMNVTYEIVDDKVVIKEVVEMEE